MMDPLIGNCCENMRVNTLLGLEDTQDADEKLDPELMQQLEQDIQGVYDFDNYGFQDQGLNSIME